MLYRIARSYGDVYYVVAGMLSEMVGGDGVVFMLVPVGDGALAPGTAAMRKPS